MTRLLCVLSDLAAPGTVKQYSVPAGGGLGQKQEMAPPRFLVIEAEPGEQTGALLYRFDSSGKCVGDTWHKSIEEAKDVAAIEYKHATQNWQEIASGTDITVLGVRLSF